ncbi:MAG: hypothetical protein ACR2P2_06840 [Nakamurella sp.]
MVPLATFTLIGWAGDRFFTPIAGLDDTVATGGTTGVGFAVVVGALVLDPVLVVDPVLADGALLDVELPVAVVESAALPPDPTVIRAPGSVGFGAPVDDETTAELPPVPRAEPELCCGEPVDDDAHPASSAVAVTSVSTGARPRIMRIRSPRESSSRTTIQPTGGAGSGGRLISRVPR